MCMKARGQIRMKKAENDEWPSHLETSSCCHAAQQLVSKHFANHHQPLTVVSLAPGASILHTDYAGILTPPTRSENCTCGTEHGVLRDAHRHYRWKTESARKRKYLRRRGGNNRKWWCAQDPCQSDSPYTAERVCVVGLCLCHAKC